MPAPAIAPAPLEPAVATIEVIAHPDAPEPSLQSADETALVCVNHNFDAICPSSSPSSSLSPIHDNATEEIRDTRTSAAAEKLALSATLTDLEPAALHDLVLSLLADADLLQQLTQRELWGEVFEVVSCSAASIVQRVRVDLLGGQVQASPMREWLILDQQEWADPQALVRRTQQTECAAAMQRLAACKCPSAVPQVLEVDSNPSSAAAFSLLMEPCEGFSLHNLMDANRLFAQAAGGASLLTASFLSGLAANLIEAVAMLHDAAGLVHGALNLDSILVQPSTCEVRVVGFCSAALVAHDAHGAAAKAADLAAIGVALAQCAVSHTWGAEQAVAAGWGGLLAAAKDACPGLGDLLEALMGGPAAPQGESAGGQ